MMSIHSGRVEAAGEGFLSDSEDFLNYKLASTKSCFYRAKS